MDNENVTCWRRFPQQIVNSLCDKKEPLFVQLKIKWDEN